MIQFLDLKKITALHYDELHEALARTLRSGWFLKGEETATFERLYAQFTGTSHCVGCGNGLDALTLIMRAYIELGVMKPGDEVIVPANTYIASVLAVSRNNLKPVLVEADIDTLQMDDSKIEEAITPRTKAIMIVHLYGKCAYTDTIGRLCKHYGLKLIEDNAQAHGCRYGGRRTGSLGDAAAHSFYPTKNIGTAGDAGAVTTDDAMLAEMVRGLANYGSAKKYRNAFGWSYFTNYIETDRFPTGIVSARTDNAGRYKVYGRDSRLVIEDSGVHSVSVLYSIHRIDGRLIGRGSLIKTYTSEVLPHDVYIVRVGDVVRKIKL